MVSYWVESSQEVNFKAKGLSVPMTHSSIVWAPCHALRSLGHAHISLTPFTNGAGYFSFSRLCKPFVSPWLDTFLSRSVGTDESAWTSVTPIIPAPEPDLACIVKAHPHMYKKWELTHSSIEFVGIRDVWYSVFQVRYLQFNIGAILPATCVAHPSLIQAWHPLFTSSTERFGFMAVVEGLLGCALPFLLVHWYAQVNRFNRKSML